MATQKVKINMIFFVGLNYSIDTENAFKVGTHSEKTFFDYISSGSMPGTSVSPASCFQLTGYAA